MSKPIFIGNHIKPKRNPTRTEHIYGKAYVFADLHKDGHFITEVTDASHAELMLSQPKHFYPYPPGKPRLQRGEGDAAAAAAAEAARLAEVERQAREQAEREEQERQQAAAAAEAAAAEAARQAAEQAGQGNAQSGAGGEFDPALVEEARALLANEPSKMATAMQKLSGLPAMKVALALEKAGDNRKPVVKLLQDAITLAGGADTKA